MQKIARRSFEKESAARQKSARSAAKGWVLSVAGRDHQANKRIGRGDFHFA